MNDKIVVTKIDDLLSLARNVEYGTTSHFVYYDDKRPKFSVMYDFVTQKVEDDYYETSDEIFFDGLYFMVHTYRKNNKGEPVASKEIMIIVKCEFSEAFNVLRGLIEVYNV